MNTEGQKWICDTIKLPQGGSNSSSIVLVHPNRAEFQFVHCHLLRAGRKDSRARSVRSEHAPRRGPWRSRDRWPRRTFPFRRFLFACVRPSVGRAAPIPSSVGIIVVRRSLVSEFVCFSPAYVPTSVRNERSARVSARRLRV